MGAAPKPISYDCVTCGACCVNPDENRREGFTSYVEVQPGGGLLERDALRKRYVVHDAEGVPHLRLLPDGRCAALLGKLGKQVRCDVYAYRPKGCRLVDAGGKRCLQYRRERGLPA